MIPSRSRAAPATFNGRKRMRNACTCTYPGVATAPRPRAWRRHPGRDVNVNVNVLVNVIVNACARGCSGTCHLRRPAR